MSIDVRKTDPLAFVSCHQTVNLTELERFPLASILRQHRHVIALHCGKQCVIKTGLMQTADFYMKCRWCRCAADFNACDCLRVSPRCISHCAVSHSACLLSEPPRASDLVLLFCVPTPPPDCLFAGLIGLALTPCLPLQPINGRVSADRYDSQSQSYSASGNDGEILRLM